MIASGAGVTGVVTPAILATFGLMSKDTKQALNSDSIEKLRNSMKSTAVANTFGENLRKQIGGNLGKFFENTSAMYDPKSNTFNPGNTLSTAAHEIGHSSGNKFLINSKLYHVGKGLGLPTNVMAARAGIIEGRAKGRDLTKQEKNEILAANILQYSSAPMLAEEARASTRGLRHLAKTHGLKAALRSSPYLAAAFGTYAAKAATPLLTRRLARNSVTQGQDKK
jgi:hypothetical protein